MKIEPFSKDEAKQAQGFVDDYLLFQLAHASHVLSGEFHSYLKEQGVKTYIWRVLACLVDNPGLMLTELSRRVLYEQSRLTKIIDQMVLEGLVTKAADKSDRRKTALFVTEKGVELVQPLLIKAQEHEESSLAILNGRERKAFKKILQKLGRLQN